MSSQAQPHHLALDAQALREAVEAHQKYLGGRSGGRRLSLTYANLSGAMMAGAKLTRAVLDGADLSGADLAGADLSGASMKRAVLNGANLQNAILDDVDMTGVLRAPPAVTFVDDRPLDQVLAEYEAYCDSSGQRGAVHDL